MEGLRVRQAHGGAGHQGRSHSGCRNQIPLQARIDAQFASESDAGDKVICSNGDEHDTGAWHELRRAGAF